VIQACITYSDDAPTEAAPFGTVVRRWWQCQTCGTDGDGDKPAVCPVCATPADEEPA